MVSSLFLGSEVIILSLNRVEGAGYCLMVGSEDGCITHCIAISNSKTDIQDMLFD